MTASPSPVSVVPSPSSISTGTSSKLLSASYRQAAIASTAVQELTLESTQMAMGSSIQLSVPPRYLRTFVTLPVNRQLVALQVPHLPIRLRAPQRVMLVLSELTAREVRLQSFTARRVPGTTTATRPHPACLVPLAKPGNTWRRLEVQLSIAPVPPVQMGRFP